MDCSALAEPVLWGKTQDILLFPKIKLKQESSTVHRGTGRLSESVILTLAMFKIAAFSCTTLSAGLSV